MSRENKTNSALLVIERDAAIRSGMKRFLEMSGYRVTAVADEREARGAARNAHYDLVLFDSDLPAPASFAAAHRLHRRAELKNARLVVISVSEKPDAPLNHPDADKFAVACLTDVSRFDELENLLECLLKAK